MTTAGYVSIDTFLPEILQYVHGAPSILARIHVTNTIITFCERTFILKHIPTAIDLEEDTHSYTMQFCNDRYVAVAIEEARVGDTENEPPLIRTTEKEMDEEWGNWRLHTGTEPSRFWLKDKVNEIRFWPIPDEDIDDPVNILAVVRPKRDQTEFDEVIYEKWNEAITAGALAALLLIPGASWYNPDVAKKFSDDFRVYIRRARATTITAPGKYPGRVIPQSYTGMGQGGYRRTLTWI